MAVVFVFLRRFFFFFNLIYNNTPFTFPITIANRLQRDALRSQQVSVWEPDRLVFFEHISFGIVVAYDAYCGIVIIHDTKTRVYIMYFCRYYLIKHARESAGGSGGKKIRLARRPLRRRITINTQTQKPFSTVVVPFLRRRNGEEMNGRIVGARAFYLLYRRLANVFLCWTSKPAAVVHYNLCRRNSPKKERA